ncbi:hypothetical protein M0804_008410 [Polistes exclamans]|nr:hypothetical protein M0804_008410 [Polistes exclamans]
MFGSCRGSLVALDSFFGLRLAALGCQEPQASKQPTNQATKQASRQAPGLWERIGPQASHDTFLRLPAGRQAARTARKGKT